MTWRCLDPHTCQHEATISWEVRGEDLQRCLPRQQATQGAGTSNMPLCLLAYIESNARFWFPHHPATLDFANALVNIVNTLPNSQNPH